MAHEIETKVLDIDSEKIQSKLLTLGAQKGLGMYDGKM